MSSLREPLVSVIMPNFNCEKYLSEAIESILNQSYKNFEFIIIDDCSTDNSWNIIQKYAKLDKRIKAFRNERNLRIVRTRNKGFTLCDESCEYLAIFDSDDISMSKRLEEEVEFLENNKDYGVVGSNLFIVDESSKIVGRRDYVENFEIRDRRILFKSPLAQPSVLIRREVLDGLDLKYSSDGKFDRSRDFDLWVKIGDSFKVKNLQKRLLKYRISSFQGKKKCLKQTIRSTIQVQKKWMFKRDYFSFFLIFYVLLEYFLLLLPSIFVLWLFKKMEYRQ